MAKQIMESSNGLETESSERDQYRHMRMGLYYVYIIRSSQIYIYIYLDYMGLYYQTII